VKRILSFLFLFALLLSACNGTASTPLSQPQTESPTSQLQTEPPTILPTEPPVLATDIPALVEINAPLIDSPSITSIRFINERDGWAVTETQIVRTNDGGVTWYNVTPPDVTDAGYNVKLFVLDNMHAWMQQPDPDHYPDDGFLYRTSDGGLTWTNSTIPFSAGSFSFLDENNGWALASLDIGAGSNAIAIYQTTDAGTTWTRKYFNDPNSIDNSAPIPLGGLKSDIVPLNMKTAWVGGIVYAAASFYLYRTDDGGQTWAEDNPPLPDGADNIEIGIEPNQMKFVSPNTGFLAARLFHEDGTETQLAIYETHDAGDTWTMTPTLIPKGGPVKFLSAKEVIVYNRAQFYVTRDAAQTWSVITPDVNFGDSLSSMDFVNLNTGWVITIDPTTSHPSLYRTSDGGATWSPIVP